jgi:hypothetical protein
MVKWQEILSEQRRRSDLIIRIECLIGMNFIIMLWLWSELVEVEKQEVIIKGNIKEMKTTI